MLHMHVLVERCYKRVGLTLVLRRRQLSQAFLTGCCCCCCCCWPGAVEPARVPAPAPTATKGVLLAVAPRCGLLGSGGVRLAVDSEMAVVGGEREDGVEGELAIHTADHNKNWD